MNSDEIKKLRMRLGYSQQEFAALLNVSFATVNRWENGKAQPQKDRLDRIRALWQSQQGSEASSGSGPAIIPRLNFEGNAEAVKLVIDAHRLQNGHLFNKTFGLELSRVVPLPHQRIAVYEHMLPQNPLRFLLADDAGAGKTIMTGLYIREMINRGRMQRVIICCPAGLTWNWRSELRYYFDLDFKILQGADFQKGDPLSNGEHSRFIISVDTAAMDEVRSRLTSHALKPFDLAVFDEAHKLSWGDPKRKDSKTRRYRLAEALGAPSTHLLLLTATPHMGKAFPYFALWRLLDPHVISTPEVLESFPPQKRPRYFIRRLKEEMINYEGQPIYVPRLCQTVTFHLSEPEQHFYEEASEYLRWSYQTNKSINKNAAAMVVAVLQRRLASSVHAMLESLKRRQSRIMDEDSAHTSKAGPGLSALMEHFDTSTADENESGESGGETDEYYEDQTLALVRPGDQAQRRKEIEYLERIIDLGEAVRDAQNETKFTRLRELIESAELYNEKLLVFTEHRDTLNYLHQRFDALGYTGRVAAIHGSMNIEEREEQRIRFMPAEFRRALGLKDPDGPSARIMLATDAAGEGINLQFAWLMVNYDIPWNPARLEQRMGRLHRFGQKHPEVRIFNLVADNTREGDVLATLLTKLDEARKELCSDKVFDVVGQCLQEVSIRDLLREALLEKSPHAVQKKLDSHLATQKLRALIEKQRTAASTFGDVAQRLSQLRTEMEVEQFSRLLPAFIQNFLEKAAPRLGLQLEGDLSDAARFSMASGEGQWLRHLSEQFPNGLPDYLSVRQTISLSGVDRTRVAFLRPGEAIFDCICQETIRRFQGDIRQGSVFCDPTTEKPYYAAVYLCQIGEHPSLLRSPDPAKAARNESLDTLPPSGRNLMERRLIGIKWDENGNFEFCPPNHLLALHAAPKSMVWKAGNLLRHPDDYVTRADLHARMIADSVYLQQLRSVFQAESRSRADDLMRGFDFQASSLARDRSELARRVRQGDPSAAEKLEAVKSEQSRLNEEKAQVLLFEQRRSDLLEITRFERIAVALVVPDASPEARELYDKNIEQIAMRIAQNFEVDCHKAKVYDVSSPHLARGYDLESHRANGEKVVIEVKGLAGRGPVHLTENEWPAAINIRNRYWLYVVADCATGNPTLFRVSDPAFKLAVKTRQSFTVKMGDIIREAEADS
jgi:superfamily II DNA or RNA helicase